MKNKLFFAALFLAIVIPLSAQESNVVLNLNSGNFGIGCNFPLNDEHILETSVAVFSFGIEDRRTHLGIEMSPFTYFGWFGQGDGKAGISLANFSVYWNVLTYQASGIGIYLGPFTSVNCLFVREEVEWDRFVVTAGAHFGLRIGSGNLNYNALSLEMGYRNIDGASKYYIGVKCDALIALVLFMYSPSAGRSRY